MSDAASVMVFARDLSLVPQVISDLEAMGIEVRQADALPAAVRSLSEAPADVVLCVTDGLDWRAALDAVRRVRGAIPVVFLTRGANATQWLEMLDAGAFDLLDGRYRIPELRWVVSNAAGHHSLFSAAGV